MTVCRQREDAPAQCLYGYSAAAKLREGTGYDQVVESLGGHGELVERPDQRLWYRYA